MNESFRVSPSCVLARHSTTLIIPTVIIGGRSSSSSPSPKNNTARKVSRDDVLSSSSARAGDDDAYNHPGRLVLCANHAEEEEGEAETERRQSGVAGWRRGGEGQPPPPQQFGPGHRWQRWGKTRCVSFLSSRSFFFFVVVLLLTLVTGEAQAKKENEHGWESPSSPDFWPNVSVVYVLVCIYLFISAERVSGRRGERFGKREFTRSRLASRYTYIFKAYDCICIHR